MNLFCVTIVTLGVKVTDTTYVTGIRRAILGKVLTLFPMLFLYTVGLRPVKKVLTDVDYSYYLGPNYKEKSKKLGDKGRVSKIISPHVSCFDVQTLLACLDGDISFVANTHVRKIPGFGLLAEKIGCVFVSRGAAEGAGANAVDSMVQRTELIETEGQFPPLMIFPEGTCSNNTCLQKFRRGAFMDLRRCIPVTLKYKYGMVHPAIDVVDEPILVWMMCAAM